MTRGSLNLSVELLLFPFAIDQLTYVEYCDILSATFQVYQELSEIVVIPYHLFINSSAPLPYHHINHISEANL